MKKIAIILGAWWKAPANGYEKAEQVIAEL